jgi:hypothetical protein
LRSYFGGRSLAIAARTVFLEIPITRAITLTGIFSALCSLRISAQSSTESTPFTPGSAKARVIGQRVKIQMADSTPGSVFTRRRQKYAVLGAIELRLPASPYWSAEWAALGQGRDPARYWPLSHIEQWIPEFFAVAYTAGFLIVFFS